VFGYNEQQYRNRIEQAVALNHADVSPGASPSAHQEIERLVDRTIEDGLDGYAWRTDSSDLSRYEARLDRRLRKLMAELNAYKRQRLRKAGSPIRKKWPNKPNSKEK
jgi:hypothetical protein